MDIQRDATRSALLERTPSLVLGPFYPIAAAVLNGGELLSAEPDSGWIDVSGRVTSLAGNPVASALVEIWQADEQGRYRHPSASEGAPDGAFKGYGAQRKDVNGAYCFRTVMPGAYLEAALVRAPHIHFQVTGHHDRLVTQMFFPDEVLNVTDRWFGALASPHRLVATSTSPGPRKTRFAWDIVLTTG